MKKVFPPAPGQRHPSLSLHSLARHAVKHPDYRVPNRSASPRKCLGLPSQDSLGKCSIELVARIRYTPDRAWSDGAQGLDPVSFGDMVQDVRAIHAAIGQVFG